MKWEIVIGLETHAQLSTKSKIFSGASTAFGAAPNTQACAVDIALPGVLPVANRAAVEKAVAFGLLVGGKINTRSIFARKNYFYPDLPKGYQISQYETPIVQGGEIAIVSPSRGPIKVPLTRAHLEEDAGKSLHEGFHEFTGIDLNRAGTPLLEIVSEPYLESASEAVEYAKALHELVTWQGICDGNMEQGSFRCDANVSVRRAKEKLGTRCEIKNLNSFLFLQQAIVFEVSRQIAILEGGGKIVQETRLYDSDRQETRSMRTKEDAHDYRYFPDPDLLPLVVTQEMIQKVEAALRPRRQQQQSIILSQGNSSITASVLTQSFKMSDFYTRSAGAADIVRLPSVPAVIGNLITNEVSSYLNRQGLDIDQISVTHAQLARLAERIADGTISSKLAKDVLEAMLAGEGDPDEIIAKRGLKQISDSGELEKIVEQVIATNAQQVADYKNGKEKAFNSLVGQAMKLSKGKANPQQVSDILKRKLST